MWKSFCLTFRMHVDDCQTTDYQNQKTTHTERQIKHVIGQCKKKSTTDITSKIVVIRRIHQLWVEHRRTNTNNARWFGRRPMPSASKEVTATLRIYTQQLSDNANCQATVGVYDIRYDRVYYMKDNGQATPSVAKS